MLIQRISERSRLYHPAMFKERGQGLADITGAHAHDTADLPVRERERFAGFGGPVGWRHRWLVRLSGGRDVATESRAQPRLCQTRHRHANFQRPSPTTARSARSGHHRPRPRRTTRHTVPLHKPGYPRHRLASLLGRQGMRPHGTACRLVPEFLEGQLKEGNPWHVSQSPSSGAHF
jgi:hypothetical protein